MSLGAHTTLFRSSSSLDLDVHLHLYPHVFVKIDDVVRGICSNSSPRCYKTTLRTTHNYETTEYGPQTHNERWLGWGCALLITLTVIHCTDMLFNKQDYDFGWLCAPSLPWTRTRRSKQPPFYALDADLPILLAIVVGFQHSLAMVSPLSFLYFHSVADRNQRLVGRSHYPSHYLLQCPCT